MQLIGGAIGKRRKLKVRLLAQGGKTLSPLEPKEYKEAFESLDINELKGDIEKVLTDSKSWWPADFGHYGGLFVRLAWHSAGTYRIRDGRRGANRGTFEALPYF